jgi:hypothetical protein
MLTYADVCSAPPAIQHGCGTRRAACARDLQVPSKARKASGKASKAGTAAAGLVEPLARDVLRLASTAN